MPDPLHARVDALMAERKLDVLLITGNTHEHPSFFYLTKGQKMENAVLVWKRGGKKLLIGADMERDCAAQTGLEFLPFSQTPLQKIGMKHRGDPAATKVAWLSWALKKARAKGKMAIYGPVALERSVAWLPAFKRALRDLGLKLVTEKAPVLERAREIKTEEEIERMRLAGEGTKDAFNALRRKLAGCKVKGRTLVTRKGDPLTIGDLKREVRLALAKHGLVEDQPSIIAQGAEAGVPHNTGTDSRKVVANQPIIADIFPRGADGYHFDMTRTFCPGKASARLKKLYKDVRETTLMSFEAFEPGLSASELNIRSQKMLADKGYETSHTHPGTRVGYCHGLGHGVGLQVHEEPFFGKANPRELEPGMVITIEPGLYYPEKKEGVRIEDVAVVRDGYLENITNYPMELEVPLKG